MQHAQSTVSCCHACSWFVVVLLLEALAAHLREATGAGSVHRGDGHVCIAVVLIVLVRVRETTSLRCVCQPPLQ
eukprot:4324056-Amphidinium_carterae.1